MVKQQNQKAKENKTAGWAAAKPRTSGKSGVSKNARIEVRTYQEKKEYYQKAAELGQVDFSEFVIRALDETSRRIYKEAYELELSAKESAEFVKEILAAPKPNKILKSAAKRYKEKMGV